MDTMYFISFSCPFRLNAQIQLSNHGFKKYDTRTEYQRELLQ